MWVIYCWRGARGGQSKNFIVTKISIRRANWGSDTLKSYYPFGLFRFASNTKPNKTCCLKVGEIAVLTRNACGRDVCNTSIGNHVNTHEHKKGVINKQFQKKLVIEGMR